MQRPEIAPNWKICWERLRHATISAFASPINNRSGCKLSWVAVQIFEQSKPSRFLGLRSSGEEIFDLRSVERERAKAQVLKPIGQEKFIYFSWRQKKCHSRNPRGCSASKVCVSCYIFRCSVDPNLCKSGMRTTPTHLHPRKFRAIWFPTSALHWRQVLFIYCTTSTTFVEVAPSFQIAPLPTSDVHGRLFLIWLI